MHGPSDDKWHVPSLACGAFLTARQAVFEEVQQPVQVAGFSQVVGRPSASLNQLHVSAGRC